MSVLKFIMFFQTIKNTMRNLSLSQSVQQEHLIVPSSTFLLQNGATITGESWLSWLQVGRLEMVRLPLVWNKSITPGTKKLPGTGSICSSCDATQGFNSFHSYNHPFSKTDKCRWNSGPLGSLCHTSDNTELNLKEIVLFIHACLGVDRDRSFFMEEKWWNDL